MKVLVVGSGAREHALVWRLDRDADVELHAAPGNVGINQHATIHDVAERDIDGIAQLAQDLEVDYVVVGPELPLVEGLGNRLRKYGVPVVGPSAAGSRIEGSKVLAKELMDRAQVPTSRWEAFSDAQAALAAINRWRGPVVIKADGCAEGCGSFVCMTRTQAERAVQRLLIDSEYGVAGRRIVVEDFLQGLEASITVLTDGERLVPLPVVRSHKRRDDGENGPNTDGMGSWLPVDELFDDQVEEAVEAGIRPAIKDYAERGLPYQGVLYADVLFTNSGPKVLEYNCRFGADEVPSLVRALGDDVDVADLLGRTARGDLEGVEIDLEPAHAAVAITLVDEGYPRRGVEVAEAAIGGLADAEQVEGVELFYENVVETGKGKARGLAAAGGRVLVVTAVGDTIEDATARANEAAAMITFDGRYARADIAAEAAVLA